MISPSGDEIVTTGPFFVTFNTMHRRSGVYTIACLMAGLLAFSCATGMVPAPVKPLTAEQVRERIGQARALALIDTRTEYEYRQGHLPGAISVPPYKFDVLSALLPSDKGVEIVFYCRGYG
jgi:hypothetical protein